MSNIDDYNAKLEALKTIPIEEVQTPVLPIDVFLQEAENLAKWAETDKVELAKLGIAQKDLNDLTVRAGALHEAQSLWFTL